jgi:carbon-monoxide dehydrogenase small subunit/isoquinoline 1-oxidoreductase alpha subunit/xanthine dehydrogenase YagT iron-sulfur-binding subunit
MTEVAQEPRVGDDGRLIIEATVNGRPEQLRARAWHTLLESLRGIGLFGVREGCGVGMCGACTVLLDGEPVSSCLVLAPAAAGREIQTVEGLAGPAGELSDIQQAFLDHTAFQCSYCTSGFLMTAVRLAEEHPDATREDIRRYLAGNLCRCGSYVKIADAVEDVLERRRAARPTG